MNKTKKQANTQTLDNAEQTKRRKSEINKHTTMQNKQEWKKATLRSIRESRINNTVNKQGQTNKHKSTQYKQKLKKKENERT